MIVRGSGDIWEADTEALVNTVNCVGVMGKGVALAFKKQFPANFKAYKTACAQGAICPGKMFVFDNSGLLKRQIIINFPTKTHWKRPSKMEYIETGLVALANEVQQRGITSIAIPALGCGNGGLDWAHVRPRIVDAFAPLDAVSVLLFEPLIVPRDPTETM